MAARVRFDAQMMGRLGRLVGRLRALRSKREGRGLQRLGGAGDEFAGHRPWQPGEDARHLDWEMLARLDQPFVRVFEREAAERWAVLLDVSYSMDMGLGLRQQSKLQLAAETVIGLAALAIEARAVLCIVTSEGRQIEVARTADLNALMSFLTRTNACEDGLDGALGSLFALAAERERPGRVLIVGDLDRVQTDEVLALLAPGRDLIVLRVLAHAELVPTDALFGEGARALELQDLESADTLTVTQSDARAYERALAKELELWQRVCVRHNIAFQLVEADHEQTFEDVLDALLSGGRA